MSRFQSDSLVPSALPSANLGRRITAPSSRPDITTGPDAAAPSGPPGTRDDVELDRVHTEWNLRIDREVKAVVTGLRELVDLADIGIDPAPSSQTLSALHLKLKTATLIRSTQHLRDTVHELRLALVLGDDVGNAARRDIEALKLRREADALRRQVAAEAKAILHDADGGSEKDAGNIDDNDDDTDDGKGSDDGVGDADHENDVHDEPAGEDQVQPDPETDTPAEDVVMLHTGDDTVPVGMEIDADSDDEDEFETVA